LGKEHLDRLEVRARHGENVRGTIDQGRCERLAAQTANVCAFLFADLHRVKTRRLSTHGMHACRSDLDVFAVSKQTAKQPFRNGAATNITCADKENAFHDSGCASARPCNLESNRAKSIWSRIGIADD
jgi:hypothetical protein